MSVSPVVSPRSRRTSMSSASMPCRDVVADGPGYASRTERVAVSPTARLSGYGKSYDLDPLPPGSVRAYPAIVARRRPERSRPPSGLQAGRTSATSSERAANEGARLRLVHGRAAAGLRPDVRLAGRAIELAAASTDRGAARFPRTSSARGDRPSAHGALRYVARRRGRDFPWGPRRVEDELRGRRVRTLTRSG